MYPPLLVADCTLPSLILPLGLRFSLSAQLSGNIIGEKPCHDSRCFSNLPVCGHPFYFPGIAEVNEHKSYPLDSGEFLAHGNGVSCTKLRKCLFPCVPMLCPLGYQLCCFAQWVLVQITPASCANTPSLEFYSESVGCIRGYYLNAKKWIYWFSLTLIKNICSLLDQITLHHSLFLGIHFLQRDFSLLWQHSLLPLKMPRTF